VPAALHAEVTEALRAALERAERAEAEVECHKVAQAKLQAKLGAVTTLYTESMARSAALQASMSWTSDQSITG
jgi:flavin-binding protein dodecin